MKENNLNKGFRSFKSLNLVHLIISIIELFFLFIFSYIIPKKKNLVIVGNYADEYKGNSKYIFEFISSKRKKTQCIFFSSNPLVISKLEKRNLQVVHKHSLKSKWILLRAKYIFVDGSWKDVSKEQFLGRFNVINMWHGDPIKKIGFDVKDSNLYDTSFFAKLVSAFTLKQYQKTLFFITKSAFFQKFVASGFKNKNVKIVGYPSNDIFFNEKVQKRVKEYFDSIFSSQYSRVYFYAPTYREDYFEPFSVKGIEKINSILKKKNSLLLIKTHPLSNSLEINDCSNIIDISKEPYDFSELLIYCDVLISDYSGGVSDFMIQDKPVIIYNFDEKNYIANSRDLYFSLSSVIPNELVCSTEKKLCETFENLDKMLEEKFFVKKIRESCSTFNYFKDGNSSQRICNILKLE